MSEIYRFIDNGNIVDEIDMSDYKCAAARGLEPMNEACGGCAECMLMQSHHWGMGRNRVISR